MTTMPIPPVLLAGLPIVSTLFDWIRQSVTKSSIAIPWIPEMIVPPTLVMLVTLLRVILIREDPVLEPLMRIPPCTHCVTDVLSISTSLHVVRNIPLPVLTGVPLAD